MARAPSDEKKACASVITSLNCLHQAVFSSMGFGWGCGAVGGYEGCAAVYCRMSSQPRPKEQSILQLFRSGCTKPLVSLSPPINLQLHRLDIQAEHRVFPLWARPRLHGL